MVDTIYKDANDRVEKMTISARSFVFKVVVPMLLFPTMIRSYVTYFFFDPDETPFRIPLPAS